MILRQKCDTEGSNYSEGGSGHDIFACASKKKGSKIELFEQIEGIDKKGVHDVNRKVIVTEDFIQELANRL